MEDILRRHRGESSRPPFTSAPAVSH
jgi:hypothetical protein